MPREQAAETMPCRRFHFGDHFIDLDQRLIYHGNLLLEPERKEYELIALPVEAYPRTLTRRALMDALWSSKEIGDAALAQLIRRTRKLLELASTENAQSMLQPALYRWRHRSLFGPGPRVDRRDRKARKRLGVGAGIDPVRVFGKGLWP